MQCVLNYHLDKTSSDYRLLSRSIRELTSTPENVTLSSFYLPEIERNLSALVASRLKST